METPFEKLVRVIGKGEQAELARVVADAAGAPVTRQAVGKWADQIPADRILLLERLSQRFGERVSAEEMRPDLLGDIGAAGKRGAPAVPSRA